MQWAASKMLSRVTPRTRCRVFLPAGPSPRAIDLNPVVAMPVGQAAFVADAVIDIADEAS
jgi:hypothetical protein